MDAGDEDLLHLFKVLPELLDDTRFDGVVQLAPNRAGELVDDAWRVEPVQILDTALDPFRDLTHQTDVGLDNFTDAGALYLDGGRGTGLQRCLVNLTQRSGGDRLGIKTLEQRLDALAQRIPQHLLHFLEGNGVDAVLQMAEVSSDGFAHQIRARAHDLAELHKGGTQILECRAQAFAETLRRGIGVGHQVESAQHPRGQAVVKTGLAQQPGQAMARHHLQHLRQPHGVDGVFAQFGVVHGGMSQ